MKTKQEELKYTILVYPKIFSDKEEASKSIGIIKNNILDHPKVLTLKQIADLSLKCAISFGYGKRLIKDDKKSYRKINWQYQQIIAIDIDNSNKENSYLTYQEAIKLCKKNKLKPAIVYTTFSHTEEHHRYRIVFALDEKINTQEEYSLIMQHICNVLSSNSYTIADTKSLDCCRIFYPGKDIVYTDYKAIVKKKTVLSIKPDKQKDINTLQNISIAPDNSNNQICYSDNLKEIIKEIAELKKLDAHSLKQLRTLINKGFISSTRKVSTLKYNIYNIYNYVDLNNICRYIKDVSVLTIDEKASNPLYINTPETFYSLAGSIKMDKFLGLTLMKHFSCILPNHEDNNPSARVEIDKEGKYVYHCYGCDKRYNLLELLEHLTNSNHLLIKRYIALKFNINYESEWQSSKDKKLEEYADFIHSDIFQESYPLVYKTLKRKNLFGVLTMMIDLARAYVYDVDISGQDKVIFFLTLNQILNKLPAFGITKSRKSLYDSIIFLSRVGLIECLTTEHIPIKLKNYLKMIKNKSSKQYRINCYSIPEVSTELLERAEQIISDDKKHNVRAKHFCREAAVRANKDIANLYYTQSIDKPLSKEVDTFYTRYKRTAIRLLDKQGYTTEKEICGFIRGFNAKTKERYSCYCLPQLIKELNLERVNYSKQLERKYGIINKTKKYFYGISQILIRKESD